MSEKSRVEALKRYPEAERGLIFLYGASGLGQRMPTEQQLAWVREKAAERRFCSRIATAALSVVSKHIEELEEAGWKMVDAIKDARRMVPAEEEGLAAQIFAYHINRADADLQRALLSRNTDHE